MLRLVSDLESAADTRPLLLLVDDLQLVDGESVRGLRVLMNHLERRSAVLVFAARGGTPHIGPLGLSSDLQGSVRAGLLQTLALGPLDEEAVWQIVAKVLGKSPTESRSLPDLQAIIHEVGGNPYHVAEMTRSYLHNSRQKDLVTRPKNRASFGKPAGEPRGLTIPPLVRDSVLARFRELPLSSQATLEVAVHVGPEFDVEVLAVAQGTSQNAVLTALRPCVDSEWPVRTIEHGMGRFEFDHDLTFSVLKDYAPPLSAKVFRRLASWWSTRRPDDPMTEARFRFAGGDTPRALRCIQRAVESAFDEGSYNLGVDRMRVLSAGGSLAGIPMRFRLPVYVDLLRQLRERWQFQAMHRALEGIRGIPLTTESAWMAKCFDLEASIFSDHRRVIHEFRRMKLLSQQGGRGVTNAVRRLITYLEAYLLWDEDDPAEAQRRTRLALRLVRGSRLSFERYRLHVTAAAQLMVDGNFEGASPHLTAAWQLRGEGGLDEQYLFGNLVTLWVEFEFLQGHVGRARQLATEAASRARRIGDPFLEAQALLSHGQVDLQVRHVDGALASLSSAKPLFSRLGYSLHLAQVLALSATCYLLDGDWSAAERSLMDAENALTRQGNETLHRWIGSARCLVKAVQGDARTALIELPPPPPPGDSQWAVEYHCIRSRILEEAGRLLESRHALDDALHAARESGIVWDLLEVTTHLALWETDHGSKASAMSWYRNRSRLLPTGGEVPTSRWKCVATARGPTSSVYRERAPSPRSSRVDATPSCRSRILDALMNHQLIPRRSRVDPGPPALSEREIADFTGVARGSLARALGRLRDQGVVHRISVRPTGTARRVFLYSLRR